MFYDAIIGINIQIMPLFPSYYNITLVSIRTSGRLKIFTLLLNCHYNQECYYWFWLHENIDFIFINFYDNYRLCEKIWTVLNSNACNIVICIFVFTEGFVVLTELLIDLNVVHGKKFFNLSEIWRTLQFFFLYFG